MATNIRIMIETQDEIGAQHDEVSMDAAFELFKSVSGLTERGKSPRKISQLLSRKIKSYYHKSYERNCLFSRYVFMLLYLS